MSNIVKKRTLGNGVVKKETCSMIFRDTVWGKMYVATPASLCFHIDINLDLRSASQSQHFPKRLILIPSA